MTFATYLLGVVIIAILLAVLFVFCLGLMHGHLLGRGESFGAQVNDDLARRLQSMDEKLDCLLHERTQE